MPSRHSTRPRSNLVIDHGATKPNGISIFNVTTHLLRENVFFTPDIVPAQDRAADATNSIGRRASLFESSVKYKTKKVLKFLNNKSRKKTASLLEIREIGSNRLIIT